MSNMMNWKQDWYEADLKLLNSEMTKQEASLKRFMEENADILNEKPWVATGHSLGGALADFAAISSVELGMDNFSGAINFDGPGHSEEFIHKYKPQLDQIASKMVHKKASLVGNILFDLPGVKEELVQTSNESQFRDANGNPWPQVSDVPVLAEHDTQNWMRNSDGSLCEGKQDWYEFLVEKLTRGTDRLPSIIGNNLPYLINLAVCGASWLKGFSDDHPVLVKTITTAVVTFLLANPGITILTINAVAAVIVVVTVVLIAVIAGEIVIEVLEKIAEEIAKGVCIAVSWLANKATELYKAIMDTINAIREWLRNTFNAGVRYANTNPFFKVDTGKLRNYATRINNVNKRLNNLDSALNNLYWQVGLLDIWDILVANLLTSGSPTLNQIKSYLNSAADGFETAENKARGYVGG